MRTGIIVTLLLAISGAVSAAPAGDLIRRAKLAVTDELKDPESARFRNIFSMRRNVCGEVNAKNSYGGYVGFKRFVALDGRSAFMDDDSAYFETIYATACMKNLPKAPTKPEPAPYHEKSWDDPTAQ